MFAFAIWDERRGELFAARDRFGEKPFYFWYDVNRESLAFGSEIKTLVASGVFTLCADQGAIYSFLVNREIDAGTETLFAGVSSLPAAHALSFSWRDRSLKTWRYWDLDAEERTRFSNPEQYSERFLELLSDSVRIRLRSDVPVGSSLSGGLDSSTIVGLIARSGLNAGQQSFSARFHDPKFDEGEYIDRVTTQARVKSNVVYPEPARIPGEIEELTWHQDEPFYSTSIYAQWCVMRLAKEQGVTVLLDGQGGDEVLAGYHEYFGAYYAQLLKSFQFRKAYSSIRGYIGEYGCGFGPQIIAPVLPGRLRSAVKGWLRPRGLRKDFKNKWCRPPVVLKKKYPDDLHQSLYLTLTQTVLPQLLRYADRNSMAFSREVRLPFLDHRLVEFLYAIPSDQKIHDTQTKVVLRSAISGIVPEEIRNRKDKMGYAPPEIVWLRGPLRGWIHDLFCSSEFRQREWWEPKIVDKTWSRFLNGEDSPYTSILRWASLEVWAKTCLRTPLRAGSEWSSRLTATANGQHGR
jgi:asparagine synthase (glutamine-hydrolysing)